ncbi:MAG: FtsX-like permease family protein [Candidatus Aminicenantes bacterium]|nr:FtsX-like permease family protein [Candidatus Aminicenantes bacterium]
MGYEIFIARRYLTARRKQAFISVITFISALGIMIGVAALIIAVALITGFQRDVQDKILGATSHLMISDLSGEGIDDFQALAESLRKIPGIRAVSPVAHDWVLVQGMGKKEAVMLKGMDLDRERETASWLRILESGELPRPDGRDGLLLGRDLAFSLGAGPGDTVTVYTASTRLSPFGAFPKVKTFVVAGTFATGLFEFDSHTALARLEPVQRFFAMPNRASWLQVTIDDAFAAERIKARLRTALPPLVYATTWMELNKSLFSALKLEKNIIFLTITLIVVVAALNIIATLILMVMEKTRDIGVLISMGATPSEIRRIFFLQGAAIGVVGTILGTVLGMLWCAAANAFELIKVPVDIYQISHVPFKIMPRDLALIVGVSLLVSFLSTLFPSHRASKVDPVVALKYE